MRQSEASGHAPAKVILLGEHAVVHGVKAMAMSISRGARATVRRSGDPFLLRVPAWGLLVRSGDGTSSSRATTALAAALGIRLDGMQIDVDTDIPSRSGLGASAAVAAATARALTAARDIPASFTELFNAVQASERVFHGNPSGLDAAVALRGGVITFTRNEGARDLKAPCPPLLIVHSGSPGETLQTVARFAEQMRLSSEEASARLQQIAGLVEEGIAALRVNDLRSLGAVMNRNQEHLAWFGVSSPSLDRIVDIAHRAGAWGAKLTGGGGGGCAIVLAPENQTLIAKTIEAAGFTVLAS